MRWIVALAAAARLRAAGVDHRLDVLPGARHGLDFRDDAWPAMVAFLELHLETPIGGAPA